MTSAALLGPESPLGDEVRRLAAAAGVSLRRHDDPAEAMTAWSNATAVFVLSAALPMLTSLAPARRDRVFVIADQPLERDLLLQALDLGVRSVCLLPGDTETVLAHLSAVEDGHDAPAPTIAVMGGCGGSGATVLAVSLAAIAARSVDTLLVETDPWSPHARAMLGLDDQPGIGWESLTSGYGPVSAHSLRQSVIRQDLLGLLTFVTETPSLLNSRVVASVVASARQGHGAVVLDLPRHADEINRPILLQADRLIVVSHLSMRCLASTERALRHYGSADAIVVARGATRQPWTPTQLRAMTGADDVVVMADERRLDEQLDLGFGPIARRGALLKTSAALWSGLLQ